MIAKSSLNVAGAAAAGSPWRASTAALCLGALLSLGGCSRAEAAEGKPEVPAELRTSVLEEAPSDLANPIFIDFGKVELIGYELEPARLAAPGSKLQIKLFWRSTGKVEEGYRLFTHLLTPAGTRTELEGDGPLRKSALQPSAWEPGKVYVDEISVQVPDDLDAPRYSIVAGLKRDPVAPEKTEQEKAAEAKDAKDAKDEAKPETEGSFSPVYLRVLSGPSDGKNGGIVATLESGVTPGTKRARAAAGAKPALAPRRPGAPGAASAPQRLPGMRPALGAAPPSPAAAPSPPRPAP